MSGRGAPHQQRAGQRGLQRCAGDEAKVIHAATDLGIIRRKIFFLHGKGQSSAFDARPTHHAEVFDAAFVAPEVHAIEVAEGEPESRMQRVVVHRILTLHRWKIASDLRAVRRAQKGEIRARNLRVAEDIIAHRSTLPRDGKRVRSAVGAEAIRRFRVVRESREQDRRESET